MAKLGKSHIPEGQEIVKLDAVELTDSESYAQVCEDYEAALVAELARESQKHRSVTSLADCVFTE